MKIGILQTGYAPDALRPEHGDYPDLFVELLAGQGLDFRTWAVVDMEFPDSIQDADGWLITGSRHGAYEDHAFIPPLETFIRDAYGANVPLVGICFGHQIIAQALGGKVEKYRGGWSVGRQVYDWDGAPVALNAWHQDQVTALPPDAEVVARNGFCDNAALIYGDTAFTVQAHPEFSPAFVAGLAEARGRGVVPDAQIDAAIAASKSETVDNAFLARQIGEFFKQRKLVS